MREVYDGIYLFELPLKNNPLKYLNWYIIKGKEKNMIIDTGFNEETAKEMVMEKLEELNLQPENTSLFLTHLHSDHTGLAGFFEDHGYDIYMSRSDGEYVRDAIERDSEAWKRVVENGIAEGLEEDGLLLDDHPGYKYRPERAIDYIEVKPGDVLEWEPFYFKVVDLAGHTPGMIGLYDEDKSILFCGDHVLYSITPNITYWGSLFTDALAVYLKNLEKVKTWNVKHLFSSHRDLIKDVNGRIDELVNHHAERLEETRKILREYGESTVRTVTKNLNWDIRSKSWDDFPQSQKWFAAGEAHAHLEYLVFKDEVDVRKEGEVLYFSLKELAQDGS